MVLIINPPVSNDNDNGLPAPQPLADFGRQKSKQQREAYDRAETYGRYRYSIT